MWALAVSLASGGSGAVCTVFAAGKCRCRFLVAFVVAVVTFGQSKQSLASKLCSSCFFFFFLFCSAGGGEVAPMPVSSVRSVVGDPVLSLPHNDSPA